MSLRNDYPWNIHISVGGVSFEGPGMESRQEAEAIKRIVEESADGLQEVEVFRQ